MLATKEDLRKFGVAMRRGRNARGLSQRMLAESLKVSLAQINHVERGENWPSMKVGIGICRVLKLDLAEAVG